MATEKQIAGNHRNVLLSTGPRTEQGKTTSPTHSPTYGLTARHTAVEFEDRDAFNDLRAELLREYAPQGIKEQLLVSQIVDAFWRIQRIRRMEKALFDRDLDMWESATPEQTMLATELENHQQFERLRRYEGAAAREYHRCIVLLARFQERRGGQNPGFLLSPKLEKSRIS